jgi:hypothetical protein
MLLLAHFSATGPLFKSVVVLPEEAELLFRAFPAALGTINKERKAQSVLVAMVSSQPTVPNVRLGECTTRTQDKTTQH